MKTAIIIFALMLIAGIAYAGSTATPILLGELSITGCPSGSTSCWVPISSTNPLPVQLTIK